MNESKIIHAACEIAAGLFTALYVSGKIDQEQITAVSKLAWAMALSLAKEKP